MAGKQESGQDKRTGQRTAFIDQLSEAMRPRKDKGTALRADKRTLSSVLTRRDLRGHTYGDRTIEDELSWHNELRRRRDNELADKMGAEDRRYRANVFIAVVLTSIAWSVLGAFLSTM